MAPIFHSPDCPLSRRPWLVLLIIIVYAVLTFWVGLHHETWRDEAQSWLLVKNLGFFELFLDELPSQIHPPLWYFILFPLAKLGLPYSAQFAVHWLLAVGCVTLFLLRSPFRWWTKVVFPFSFFMFFEYAVVSRNYTIGILILFALAACHTRRYQNPYCYAILVFLLYQTHYFLFTAGLSLTALFLWGLVRGKRDPAEPCHWIAAVVMVLGAVLSASYLAILPADHFNYGYHPSFHLYPFVNTLGRAAFPTLCSMPREFDFLICVTLLILITLMLIRKPSLLFAFWGSLAGMFTVFLAYGYYGGSHRHAGYVIMVVLFVLWLDSVAPKKTPVDAPESKPDSSPQAWLGRVCIGFVTILLAGSIRYSVLAGQIESSALFSGSKNMARTIRILSDRYGWKDEVIVANPSSYAASVAVYLPERTFWYADVQQYGTFWKHSTRVDTQMNLSTKEIFRRTTRQFPFPSQVLFLFSKRIPEEHVYGYDLKLLQAVNENIWGYGHEEFYLYKALPHAFLEKMGQNLPR